MVEKRRTMMADWRSSSGVAPSHNFLPGRQLDDCSLLTLLRPTEGSIARLFVLARMSYEDSQDDRLGVSALPVLISADNSSPDLNILEADIVKPAAPSE